MDILYFLRRRLDFIRKFYDTASEPFITIMGKIERVEEPYTEVDDEGGESPHQGQWNDCYDSLDVLGQNCLGMLTSTLRLYLDEYLDRIGKRYARRGKQGWLIGMKEMFLEDFKVDWKDSGARLDILEQSILSRNDFEHAGAIHSMAVHQDPKHFSKYKDSFFADKTELAIFSVAKEDGEREHFFPCHLNVSRDSLFAVIDEVGKLCEWLETL